MELKIFDRLKNFFRDDIGEVVGIYHDGEKIFLARLTDKLETLEQNFEIDFAEKIPPAEQLAEKVFLLCSQRGWSTSKTALCLQEGETVTFQPNFENIPAEQIESAVKVWAEAQSGKNALYTFAKVCGEFWTEAMSKKSADEYFSAWEKNSMTLCEMTSLTGIFSDKAAYVARLAAEKKSPNLVKNKIGGWNWKKIFAVIFGIFIFVTATVFGKLFYDLHTAQENFSIAQKNLSDKNEIITLQADLEKNISEMKMLNELLAAQVDSSAKLNTLIKLGKVADDKIQLTKITLSGNVAELEGVTEKADNIKNYLRSLKISVTTNATLESATAADGGKINFVIRLTFETELKK